MKKFTLLLLFLAFCMSSVVAQLPNVPHASYTTKSGEITDARDGKIYVYKTYGKTDWFMHNLNWDGYDGTDQATQGSIGAWGSADADGSKFGRFYLTGITSETVCPQGWNKPIMADWKQLIKDIASEYAVSDLIDTTDKGYTFNEAMKYMRGGEIKPTANALWETGTGTVDAAKANLIQFNILPSGEYNGTGGYVTKNEVGKRTWLLSANNDRYQNNPSTGSGGYNALRHEAKANVYGVIRCVREASSTKQDQTITFAPLANMKMGDADLAPGATASSRLAVTYTSSDPSIASIVDGKIHVLKAGTVAITASQMGNDKFFAAKIVTQELVIGTASGLKSQEITFAPLPTFMVGDANIILKATTTSGLAITYTSSDPTKVTIKDGNKMHALALGTASITASQAGNAEYDPAIGVTQEATVKEAGSYLPNVPYADYSTLSGTITDARDGKRYAYKNYGELDWFMHNLNWNGYDGTNEATIGTVGVWGSSDPDGSKFGRFYQGNGTPIDPCPTGWERPTKTSWADLIKYIATTYDAPDLKDASTSGYTFYEAMKYMRAGDIKPNQPDALWDATTGTVDAIKANQIQFNLLPMGEHNGTDYVAGNEVGKKIWLLSASNERYQNNTSGDSNGANSLRHEAKAGAYGAIRCVRMKIPDTEIITPYPTTLEIKQINSAQKEVDRHLGRMIRYDHVVTGYYVERGKKLNIKLETLTPATDGAKPQLVIGSRGQMPAEETAVNGDKSKSHTQLITEINLTEGINAIDVPYNVDFDGGGMIYFRYVTQAKGEPVGKIKVTLMDDGDQTRAPYYVRGVTSADEFKVMMATYTTPEVTLCSDEVVAVTSRIGALTNSVNTDKELWFDHMHKLLEIEDDISGFDDNDSNSLHHRSKKGEIRHLMVQTRFSSPNASSWRTAFPGTSRYLTPFKTPTNGYTNVSWQVAHEVGHQHQQHAYMHAQAGETTVNIYSFKVAAHFDNGGNPYVRTPDVKLNVFHRTYMKLPDDKRIYEMNDADLNTVIEGINRDEMRMVPWELMFYIFGDDFFKTLHRITREEKVTNQGFADSGDRKKAYAITRASLISGYDLRKYYDAWGIRVTDATSQKEIDRMITEAGLQEPPRIEDLPYVSGTKFFAGEYAGWLPLSMKGIKTSSPSKWNWNPNATDPQPKDRLAAVNKYCDYSTQTEEITDPRDGKKYPVKRYKNQDWFMTNLDWNGYDGVVEESKNSVGIYTDIDPEGKVYGRMYPTYQTDENNQMVAFPFCPTGWTNASQDNFKELLEILKTELKLGSLAETVKCMKCGGDRDVVADGLWKTGAATIDVEKAKQIGFNILPSGVFNIDTENYDAKDAEGSKASFVNGSFYHATFDSDKDILSTPNRNMRHHSTVRCMRIAEEGAKLGQTIAFTSLGTVEIGTADITLAATATSELAVTYISSDPTVASVTGNVLKVLKVGTAIITANQAGDDKYLPATISNEIIIVDKIVQQPQTITFASLGTVKMGVADITLSATATSGLAVTYTSSDATVASVTGNVLKVLKVGTAIITANQAGDAQYLPATAVTSTITIVAEAVQQPQTITFASLGTVKMGVADIALSATATSGLAVTYTSSDATVASVTGNMLKVLKVGTAIITANQAGDAQYLPATAVTSTLRVIAEGDIDINDVEITIAGQVWDKESKYSVPCDDNSSQLNLTIDPLFDAQLEINGVKQPTHTIDLGKATLEDLNVKVVANNGVDSKTYVIKVEKKFNFTDIVAVKWGNTYIVNNNPNNNAGYSFSAYKWFKDGTNLSDKQYIHVNDEAAASVYTIQLTTNKGVLETCPQSITARAMKLKVYPSIVRNGETVSVDANDMPQEFVTAGAQIYVYSMTGYSVTKQQLKEIKTLVTLPSAPGMYIIKVKSEMFEQDFKVIVK